MTRRRQESLSEYVRRHLPEPPEQDPPTPTLSPAPGCARRRVQAAPPRFESQEEAGRRFAARQARLWSPELVDVKRLDGGRTGLLYRGRRGEGIGLVLTRAGRVKAAMSPAAWKRLEEVLA